MKTVMRTAITTWRVPPERPDSTPTFPVPSLLEAIVSRFPNALRSLQDFAHAASRKYSADNLVPRIMTDRYRENIGMKALLDHPNIHYYAPRLLYALFKHKNAPRIELVHTLYYARGLGQPMMDDRLLDVYLLQRTTLSLPVTITEIGDYLATLPKKEARTIVNELCVRCLFSYPPNEDVRIAMAKISERYAIMETQWMNSSIVPRSRDPISECRNGFTLLEWLNVVLCYHLKEDEDWKALFKVTRKDPWRAACKALASLMSGMSSFYRHESDLWRIYMKVMEKFAHPVTVEIWNYVEDSSHDDDARQFSEEFCTLVPRLRRHSHWRWRPQY